MFQFVGLANGDGVQPVDMGFQNRCHMALNLIKKEETKDSNRVKFKRAGWNDEFLIKLLAQN
ncbi:MAG TPA: hypothetical protein QF772_08065 [Nitrospinaceae bacterium]|nr:hypothetical protein [Nitrospinaceae bacterium]